MEVLEVAFVVKTEKYIRFSTYKLIFPLLRPQHDVWLDYNAQQ